LSVEGLGANLRAGVSVLEKSDYSKLKKVKRTGVDSSGRWSRQPYNPLDGSHTPRAQLKFPCKNVGNWVFPDGRYVEISLYLYRIS
jgi:hypothetical protein